MGFQLAPTHEAGTGSNHIVQSVAAHSEFFEGIHSKKQLRIR